MRADAGRQCHHTDQDGGEPGQPQWHLETAPAVVRAR